jgi:hypothetical protein
VQRNRQLSLLLRHPNHNSIQAHDFKLEQQKSPPEHQHLPQRRLLGRSDEVEHRINDQVHRLFLRFAIRIVHTMYYVVLHRLTLVNCQIEDCAMYYMI